MAKITDVLKTMREFSFSFEVTPDISEYDLDNLLVEPIFFSITWHAKSHQNKNLDIPPLKIAKHLRNKGKNVLLHLSCDMLRKDFLAKLLVMLQEKNIRNLFVILGERYDPDTSDFKSSKDLITHIREATGEFFCIGVAGTPDCSDDSLLILKDKVDAGADFVLTQAFFEAEVYDNFVDRCEKVHIYVPIIPGMFYFETYEQLSGFINLCKIKVSDNLLQIVKNEDQSRQICGGDIVKKAIHTINKDVFHHFHFFTMNKLEHVSGFIKTIF